MNKLLEELRDTKYICLRHDVRYYRYFESIDTKREGYWYERDNVHGTDVRLIKNLMPTDRFEFREDGEWAQVYLYV